MIGMIGCGAMGSALAKQLAASGEDLVVWDLRPENANSLRSERITPASSAGQTITQSSIIVICIPSYEDVVPLLEENILSGKTILNLTTGTPEEAEAMLAKVEARGGEYLDGSILCRPDEVGTAGSNMLVSGRREIWDRAEPHVGVLAHSFRHVSDNIGAANALELAVYGSYGLVGAIGLVEGISYAISAGVGEEDFIAVLETTTSTVAALAREGFRGLKSGDFAAPGANLAIYLHAAESFLASFARRRRQADMLKAASARFRSGVNAGMGDLGLFALTRLDAGDSN